MSQGRVEMLSREAARTASEELELPDGLARLNIFRTLLRRPRTAKAVSDLLFSLLVDPAIEPRLRELAIMRIGWVTGCDYEWTQHWPLAHKMYGCTREELLAVRDWRAAECFDARDRAVLAATDELVKNGDLGDEGWSKVEAALGEEASIDLVASIGLWSLVSTIVRGLRIPLEEGIDSWPPDGVASPAEAKGSRLD